MSALFEIIGYLTLAVVFMLGGYLVSIFANAIYIEPDELRALFPGLSGARKRRLEKFISDPRAFFQVAVFSRVTGSICLGMIAFLAAHQLVVFGFRPFFVAYILAFIVLWAPTLVFYIYLPRRIPHQQAKTRLIGFLPLFSMIYVVSSPFIRFFGLLTRRGPAGEVSEEQKDDIVERAIETLAESSGISAPIIEEDEKEMIHQIFQLDVTEVEEIMIPRIKIIGISENATLADIVETVAKFGFSRYPVFEETIDRIIGIIKVKDLLLLDDEDRRNFKLSKHIREPYRIGEHKKIDQLLAEFKKNKNHMAIVMDEFGGTAGIVTLEDILEEIVGDIQEEHDALDDRLIVRLTGGRFEVSGSCPLDDLDHELDIDLDQDEFETVGGMIYDRVGSIPAEGTTLTWKTCHMRVIKVDGQRITKVLVSPQS
jgi:putative hemolysin